jgi:hypothetical protein
MNEKTNRNWAPERLAEIAHRLPRRIRFRAPLLAFRDEPCRRMAKHLTQLDSAQENVDKVRVNVMTGSIIVEAENGSLDAETLLAHVREFVEIEMKDVPDRPPGPTQFARSVARAFAGLNEDVRGGLRHRADLATLLPIVLGTLALGQIVRTGRLPAPAWFNFCWWSFRAFMTFHKDATREERSRIADEIPSP